MAAEGFVYRWLLFGTTIVLLAEAAQRHTASDNPSTYNIGGVLSNSDSEEHFSTTIKASAPRRQLTGFPFSIYYSI